MDPNEMTTFVEQLVADAERAFGLDAEAALLERYAREAALELWLTTPRVTVSVARRALRQVYTALEQRAGVGAPAAPDRPRVAGRAA